MNYGLEMLVLEVALSNKNSKIKEKDKQLYKIQIKNLPQTSMIIKILN